MLIGVISDTHGYLDPRLETAFRAVDAIVHAGDVGGTDILDALRAIAPLYAVRGNNDERLGGLGLPLHHDFKLADVLFHLVHQLSHARPAPGTRVVVYGHSHRTLVEDRNGVLYLNPGAAGRTGFHRLQTVALLDLSTQSYEARIVELGPREARPRRPAVRAREG
ncbi:MAG: metallophosphoesterase family protein [Dehalococcoidia bacterium]